MQNHASSTEGVVHIFHYLLVGPHWQRSEEGFSNGDYYKPRGRHTLTFSVESGVPMLLAGNYLIVNIPVCGTVNCGQTYDLRELHSQGWLEGVAMILVVQLLLPVSN